MARTKGFVLCLAFRFAEQGSTRVKLAKMYAGTAFRDIDMIVRYSLDSALWRISACEVN